MESMRGTSLPGSIGSKPVPWGTIFFGVLSLFTIVYKSITLRSLSSYVNRKYGIDSRSLGLGMVPMCTQSIPSGFLLPHE
jgi:hypothetical protein